MSLDPFAPAAVRRSPVPDPEPAVRLGQLDKAYVIWISGASCHGCTVAVTASSAPRLEQLLGGAIPGLPRIELVHTDLSVESGAEWIHNLVMAERGELDAPYIVTCEGSVLDESRAGDGFWGGLGTDPVTGAQLTSRDWLLRLAPGAAAVIAIGTCATFGGVPAATGNATGAMSVGDCLGPDYRSTAGLPLVNVPGCAPTGDNYLELVGAVLLFLNRLAPPPDLDELGRPTWLYSDTVHARCTRGDDYINGILADEYGGEACLLELGCCGPVAVCNVAERGVVDGHGGCMSMGGICIGCTMPGFPDAFLPLARHRDGTLVARRVGSFQRRLGALRHRAGGPEAGGSPAVHRPLHRPAPVARFWQAGRAA